MAKRSNSSIEPPLYAALHRNLKMGAEWAAIQQVLGFSRFWEIKQTGIYPTAMGIAELILAVHLTQVKIEDLMSNEDETLIPLILQAVEIYRNILYKTIPYEISDADLAEELKLNAQGYFLRDDYLIRKNDSDYVARQRNAHSLFRLPFCINMTYYGTRSHAIREAKGDVEAGLFTKPW